MERLGDPLLAVRMTPRGEPVEIEAADFDPHFDLALDPEEGAQLAAERAEPLKIASDRICTKWKRHRTASRGRRGAR